MLIFTAVACVLETIQFGSWLAYRNLFATCNNACGCRDYICRILNAMKIISFKERSNREWFEEMVNVKTVINISY